METTIGSDSTKVYENIFPAEAWELISENRGNDKLVILDVSTPDEFKDLHLEGAINASLLSRFFKARLDIIDMEKTYVVYCKVGVRSKAATKLMKMLGFQTVYNITGGTLLWEEEGLPLASGTSGVNKLSLCPFLIFTLLLRKVRKGFNKIFHRPVGSIKNVESLS